MSEDIISSLARSMPPIFARSEVPKLTGGAIAAGTLANLATTKSGPPYRIMAKKAVYCREEFLVWLASKIEKVE